MKDWSVFGLKRVNFNFESAFHAKVFLEKIEKC